LRPELIDQSLYLSNRRDFIRLLEYVYSDTSIEEIVSKYRLVVVGGQALAFWHYQYLMGTRESDFNYAFSDDLDFYGLKVSVEFLNSRMHVKMIEPQNFESTINLGICSIPTLTFPEGVIVEVINSVGGLTDKEIGAGIAELDLDGLTIPIINPILCLKSRINNVFATYKPDKVLEKHRVALAVRICVKFLDDMIDLAYEIYPADKAHAEQKKAVFRYIEQVFEAARAITGCDLFIRDNIDIMPAINAHNPLFGDEFLAKRLPAAREQVMKARVKRLNHLIRFEGMTLPDHCASLVEHGVVVNPGSVPKKLHSEQTPV
jgi:hypothetical protein